MKDNLIYLKISFLVILCVTIGIIPVFLNGYNGIVASDFTLQQIPFILETKRMLASGQPWWSWNTMLGDNFIGAYSFYTLTSPFVWIATLFSADDIVWGIILIFYLKCICTASIAYAYFKRMDFPNALCVGGGLLYLLSSCFISNLRYFHFAEPMMMLPLLLIVLENTIDRRKYCFLQLTLVSTAIIFINFYFALSTFLIGFLYFIFRSRSQHKLSGILFLKSFGCILYGALLCAVILLPAALHMKGVPRASVQTDITSILGFDINSFKSLVTWLLNKLYYLIIPSVAEGFPSTLFYAKTYYSFAGFVPVIGLFPWFVMLLKLRNWIFSCSLYCLLYTSLH